MGGDQRWPKETTTPANGALLRWIRISKERLPAKAEELLMKKGLRTSLLRKKLERLVERAVEAVVAVAPTGEINSVKNIRKPLTFRGFRQLVSRVIIQVKEPVFLEPASFEL